MNEKWIEEWMNGIQMVGQKDNVPHLQKPEIPKWKNLEGFEAMQSTPHLCLVPSFNLKKNFFKILFIYS